MKPMKSFTLDVNFNDKACIPQQSYFSESSPTWPPGSLPKSPLYWGKDICTVWNPGDSEAEVLAAGWHQFHMAQVGSDIFPSFLVQSKPPFDFMAFSLHSQCNWLGESQTPSSEVYT